MPLAALAERDVNLQHQLPLTRGKRLPAAGSVAHENSALSPSIPRAKATPTQPQRFLAPTKASVAKNTPPPSVDRTRAQPHSGRSTPLSQPHTSRLPRRNAATPTPKPAFSPPLSRWNASATPVVYADSSADSQRSSPSPSPCGGAVNDQSLVAVDALPRTTHRARVEKPLPPRPIASLVYASSPSRDSRCLIDASERPLRQSGSERDWPTLIPTSASTPVLVSERSDVTMTDTASTSARFSTSAISISDFDTELTSAPPTQRSDSNMKISGSPEQRSASMSSSISTSELGHPSQHVSAAWKPRQSQAPQVKHDHEKTLPCPPRKSSLPSPSLGRSQSASTNVAPSPDFVRDAFEASRPHSPSPASFSRPRPTSFSQMPSVTSIPTTVEITPVKSQKTASRIPLPDQKKATLVDIKTHRISSIPMPKFEKGLSFGGRRIDSPDPLKVLDHGIKRRQLRRANTGGSASTASTVPTRLLSDGTSLPLDRSKANTPGSTMGSTSDDEEEITTPSDKSLHYVKHGYKPKHINRASSGSHYAGATLKVYDEAEVVLGRPPPSNSPFTGPLQTIPSQSLLPLEAMSNRERLDADPRPKVVIKPTEFSAFAQRLSVLEDSHALAKDERDDHRSPICANTKTELVDILREAEHADALISQCGAKGLDAETKEEITRTLSMLEGKCGPANTIVDLEHLTRMFGRLKSGFDKAPKSAAFVEDATVAERFLARKESTASEAIRQAAPTKDDADNVIAHTPLKDEDAASQLSRSKTVASKWSNSTASAKEHSLPFAQEPFRRNIFGMDFTDLPPGLPPKDLQDCTPTSIGYPSRTPGKAHRLLGTDERGLKQHKSATRRVSSPTFGVRVPGSVRAAREKARDAAGGRANKPTSTKMEKMPTPNTKVFRVSEDPPRGRLPSAEKSSCHVSSKVDSTRDGYSVHEANLYKQLPRSRSKSRYVLDKINGLFSGRRDRRTVELPPVPPVKDLLPVPPIPKEVRINSVGSPMVTGSHVSPLTKMPTISHPADSVHPALRSATSSNSVALSAATIGSDADYEGRRSLQVLSEKLLGRAVKEGDPAKKERLLNFAKILNDSLISAREAQISAETAATAARSAQLSYEMTMKSVAMLQRLASSMNRR